ncbi:elongator complex protein 1 isoform X1 [Punica granatum]|uniref:Elongator complex protein 1 n=2 Tax=Punica granatum TaxID=22663 RepID=A0A6P8BTT0_PUNGR|nr:elongator complex protein 1 isoform X1 [Punica granatum]
MKNLKLSTEASLNVELQAEDEVLLFSAFDIERNRLFFVSSANFIYTTELYSFQNDEAWRKTVVPAEVDQVDLEDGDFVTAFDYLMEKEALILGTSNGLMLLHSVDAHVTEVVGRVEGGIKCISPSPDGDLLGITTGFGQLLVMTHDWDLLHETTAEDLPEAVDVNESTFSSAPMFGSSISWRGDGKYFATLSELCNSSMHKRIKVWDRDSGTLLATSEAKPLVGTVLEWMPSGAKIAAVCERKMDGDSPLIIFFERNGLERSSFSINDQVDSKVQILKWNCSSDLLGALVSCENHDCVKIWSCSNNHWYLKHELRYPREDGLKFMWNPAKPFQLICWTLRGQITTYNFIWTTAISENSTAFVIDGNKILVTPLSISLLPPPMYLFSLQFSSAVRDIAFCSKNSKSSLAAYLSDGCLCIVELPEIDMWEELEGKEYRVEASLYEAVFGSFVHLTWLDTRTLLGVSSYESSHIKCHNQTSTGKERLSGYYMQEMELFCSEDHVPSLMTCSGWHVNIANHISLETPVVGIAANPAKKSAAYIQFNGGIISEYTSKLSSQGGSLRRVDSSFSSTCLWMSAVLCVESSDPLLFGLDEVGRLQVGGKILCNNCSTFSFYSNLADQTITHLILATKQDLLFIIEIRDILHGDVEEKYENFTHSVNKKLKEEKKSFVNIWEKGAKIVGVLHGDEAAVIIQTNRGNLECIYPRKLVLASIINALVQLRFKDALLMVRRHRIDFNVIVDHFGWQVFLQHAPEFVKQVENLNHLTEFIFSIKRENTSETLYKSYISLPSAKEAKDAEVRGLKVYDTTNKVSSVLLAIRKAIEEQLPETPARELCVLTTFARSDPPALEEALKRVKAIREMELLDSDDPKRKSYPSAEEALKHLLWLSDAEAVYEAALGLYDLNLAAMVALNSQKDPKEFLPFLQELQRMPSLLMRYTIDLKLRRFENALRHIASAGDAHYNDFMNLIKKNPQLFPLGLQLIADPAKKSQVLEAWGDHLNETKCFEDAAITFLCCSNLEKALKAYRSCGNWAGVLTIASLLKLGSEEILQLAHELCEELQALGKPADAAKIALEYCRDVKLGLGLLIGAQEWEEAMRVAFMHREDDLISEVKTAALECASTLVGEYEEGLVKVGKYLARYLAVRQRRLILAAKVQSAEQSMTDLDDDTASEASSNFSGMSAYTAGTRRGSTASISSSAGSRAREARRQRNRGKIRPGSPGEELALVDHLKGMSLTAGAMRELRSLLICLVTLREEETARKLQHIGECFQLSQLAAVKLAEDTMNTDAIDEQAHTLDRYLHKVRVQSQSLEVMSWRHKVFVSP